MNETKLDRLTRQYLRGWEETHDKGDLTYEEARQAVIEEYEEHCQAQGEIREY